MRKVCVQDIENISSCSFCVYPVVPIKLGKVIKYEAKQIMSNIYLETLNIEWGQIDPKHNRRVKKPLPFIPLTVTGCLQRAPANCSTWSSPTWWTRTTCGTGARSPRKHVHTHMFTFCLTKDLRTPRCVSGAHSLECLALFLCYKEKKNCVVVVIFINCNELVTKYNEGRKKSNSRGPL